MERVYISGKITGLDNHAELFEQAEKRLIEQGYEVINPVKINHAEHDQSWESFMKADLVEMFKCDSIYLLENWRDSKGAVLEWFVAKELKMKVYYEDKNR